MNQDHNSKFLRQIKKILRVIRPRFSLHYVSYTVLLFMVVFSVVHLVGAATPNPGHPWSEVGDGVIVFDNGQTVTSKTYTLPFANTTILTTNALVTVGQGGIGVGTLASNGVLYGNGTSAVQALAVNAGATQCLTQASSAAPAWGACGSSYTFSTGLTNSSGTITANLSTGLSGGQSVIGGTASGENLTLSSTSNATKGKILFGTSAYDELNNRLGIGTASPSEKLHIIGNALISGSVQSGVAGSSIGSFKLAGNTSGIISINPQAVAGTYNFNLPASAGTSGDVLTSAGGGAAAMTWTTLNSIATTGLTNGSGTTANGTAVDLGGVMSTDALVDGTNTYKIYLGGLTEFGIGGDLNDPLAAIGRSFIGFIATSRVGWIGDNSIRSNGTNIFVDDNNQIGYFKNGSNNAFFGINNDTPTVALDVVGTGKITSTGGVNGFDIIGGTLDDTINALKVVATLPGTGSSAGIAINAQVTSSDNGQNQYPFNLDLLAGGTDAVFSGAGRFANSRAGSGTGGLAVWGGSSNNGIAAIAQGTGAMNVGGTFSANSGTSYNIGVQAITTTAQNSGTNIGVLGVALNTGTSPTQIGGYFGLKNSAPSFTSAALIADNGSTTSPIFLARDNSSTVFSIADGGNVNITTLSASSAVYTDGSKNLVSTAPTSGTIGYWSRSGTVLSPAIANDLISISTNSTTASNKAIEGLQTGATTAGSATDYAGYFSNTGAATNNVGLYATATGGTNNYAAIFDAGNVGIGTTTPATTLQINGTYTSALNPGIRLRSTNPGLALEDSDGTGAHRNFTLINAYTGAGKFELLYSATAGGTPATTAFNVDAATGFMGLGSAVSAANRLDVNGSAAIGASYYGVAAPVNGLVVQGETYIGSATDLGAYALQVTGSGYINTGSFYIDSTGSGTDAVKLTTAATNTLKIQEDGNTNGANIRARHYYFYDDASPTNGAINQQIYASDGSTLSIDAGSTTNNIKFESNITTSQRSTVWAMGGNNLTYTTNTFENVLSLQRVDTAANNIAAAINFNANRTTGGQTDVAKVSGMITDITNAAYKGALVFSTANNAAPAERFRIAHDGTLTATSLATGGTECLQATAGGVISKTGSACGAGGGGLTVGTTAIASGGANRVLFENGSNVLSENANFTYDGTTLGVATSSTTASNKALNISQTGATSGTDYAGYFSNTGAATTNVGLYTTASGGTTNLALNVDAGQTLLGGTTLTSGTLAKLNIVSTMASTGSTTAIAGIHGDYTFNNGGTASYVQVGNRFVFNNAPTTNSNTMVGEVIRTIDNTTLANLVRGIEIVSNAGSNTAGTNTGLRSTGATFGVQAITSGGAGGVSLPAGLYAENTGTTQGDVARFYTSTMTSAPSMLNVYHDTSTFTGDGLLMDMAVSTGTFSGNFLDFKNASVLKFKVTSAGVVSMGLSATASTNAVCSSLANATAPTAGTAYEIRDCNAAPAADYAEMYPVESGIEFGDIVATGTEMVNTYDTTLGNVDWTKVKGKVTRLIKSSKSYQSNVIGIVADNYGDFTSAGHNIKDVDNPMPIALNGRVPVKVSSTSDSILPGDYITTSDEQGKATKATKGGFVIGKALEAWTPNSGQATVMVYVEQGFYNGQSLTEFAGISTTDGMFARQILQKFLANIQTTNTSSSELLLDRLAVGVQIVTPKVVADNVELSTITAGQGNDIGLVLGPNGKFIIGTNTASQTPAITFDSLGNATFAGTVTAKEIKIDNLAGIQDITDQINNLAEGQQAFTLTAQVMNTLSSALSLAQADILKLQSDLATTNENIAGLTTSGEDIDTRLKVIESFLTRDANGQVNGFAVSMLTVTGDSSFTGKAQFDGLSFFSNTTSFAGSVTFAGATEFALPPLYNKDSAGYALVKQGDRRVKILFSQPYIATPVVNTSVTFETGDNIDDVAAGTLFTDDIRFIIVGKDQTGFTILLNKPATRDIRFSWNALSVKDPTIFESIAEQLGLNLDISPDPTPTPDPTPNPVPTCVEPQVLDTSTNTCVDQAPDSTPTPDPTPDPEPNTDSTQA